jgi:hypothetical protein
VLLAFIKVAILVANNETSFHLQLLYTCRPVCVLWSGFVVLLSHLLWLYSSCGNAMQCITKVALWNLKGLATRDDWINAKEEKKKRKIQICQRSSFRVYFFFLLLKNVVH